MADNVADHVLRRLLDWKVESTAQEFLPGRGR